MVESAIKDRLMAYAPIAWSNRQGIVKARDLCGMFAENLLKNARVVYSGSYGKCRAPSYEHGSYEFSSSRLNEGTHSAILLDVQPLDHRVEREEVLDALRSLKEFGVGDLCDRVERWGVK